MARIVELTDLSGAYASRLFVEAGHEVIRDRMAESRTPCATGNLCSAAAITARAAPTIIFSTPAKKVWRSISTPPRAGRFSCACSPQSDVLIAKTPLAIEDAALIAANAKLVYTKIEDEEA